MSWRSENTWCLTWGVHSQGGMVSRWKSLLRNFRGRDWEWYTHNSLYANHRLWTWGWLCTNRFSMTWQTKSFSTTPLYPFVSDMAQCHMQVQMRPFGGRNQLHGCTTVVYWAKHHQPEEYRNRMVDGDPKVWLTPTYQQRRVHCVRMRRWTPWMRSLKSDNTIHCAGSSSRSKNITVGLDGSRSVSYAFPGLHNGKV